MADLVTGASGFLGGALARILIERGKDVRALVRSTSSVSHLEGLPIEIVVGDLADRPALEKAVKDVSIVYHCAALSSDWGPSDSFEAANVDGVQNLLHAAEQAETIQRFVHVSTTDVYGYPKTRVDEASEPTNVGLPYNRTKIAGENLVRDTHERDRLPVTIIRPATVFGPRSAEFATEMAGLLLDGGLPLIGGGTSQAGLVYVDDVAEAMITAAYSARTIGGTYNVRDPEPMTWSEYIAQLAEGIGAHLPRLNIPTGLALMIARGLEAGYGVARAGKRPLLTRHAVLVLTRPQDYLIARAERDFGFEPSVGLAIGIQRTVGWLNSDEGLRALAERQ